MNQKNKLTVLLLTGISTMAIFTSVSFASLTGTITSSTVRMREEPSTSSKIVLNLDENNKVNVLEKNDDWYKVSYDGKTGYVFGKYLKVSGDIGNTENKEPVSEGNTQRTEENVQEAVNTDNNEEKIQNQTVSENSRKTRSR